MEKEDRKAGKLVYDTKRKTFMINNHVVHLRDGLILFVPITDDEGKPDYMAYDIDLRSKNNV